MSTLSLREQGTIIALCQAIVPPVPSGENGLLETGPEELNVPAQVLFSLENLPNPADLGKLRLLLRLIDLTPVNFALSGIGKPFVNMAPAEKEKYLLILAQSKIPDLRAGFKALKALIATTYFSTPTDLQGRPNPSWQVMGYPGPLFPPPAKPKPIKPLKISTNTTLSCDAVVIGSGAGGGVVAGELAAAGKDVIVLEKGGYYNEADFTQVEADMLKRLYLDGGQTATRDQSIAIMAGSCLGGGTVVNYTTSFATPSEVRREWDSMEDFRVFDTPEYEASSQAVHERLGVSTKYNRLSQRDEIMTRGLQKLGWHQALMPRNVRGCSQEDDCGYCIYGCHNGAKQSTLITWLQDAHERGTRMVVNCSADKILTEGGRASGIAATVTNPENGNAFNLTIRAKAVVVACGSLHTPALLLRSGLGGPAVGKYLRLHPATPILAIMEEEVNPWAGVMQAAYSDQFADLDGKGYGVRFETIPAHAVASAYSIGWQGGKKFKEAVGSLSHMTHIGALLRDNDSGQVKINRQGRPVVDYRLSKYDIAHLRKGLEGAAKVLETAGAKQLMSANTVAVTYRPGEAGQSLQSFMGEIDQRGWGPNQMSYFSFHQMGSCRMGSNPATSVVNQFNEAHSTLGLFIADASAFPTASGVNPMITIETIAHRAVQFIKSMV